MSLMWIPPHTTVPPEATARSATGTSEPTGAKMMTASSGSGGRSSELPAHSAPSSSANCCAARSPGQRPRCGPRARIGPDPALRLLGLRIARRPRGLDACDDLMAQHAGRMRDLELSIDQVQVRAADSACVDSQQELSLRRL